MNFGYVILSTLSLFFNLMTWVVLIRCILSYGIMGENFLTNLIYLVTEPFLKPIRILLNKIPAFRNSRIDFSPLIFVLLVSVIDGFLNF